VVAAVLGVDEGGFLRLRQANDGGSLGLQTEREALGVVVRARARVDVEVEVGGI